MSTTDAIALLLLCRASSSEGGTSGERGIEHEDAQHANHQRSNAGENSPLTSREDSYVGRRLSSMVRFWCIMCILLSA